MQCACCGMQCARAGYTVRECVRARNVHVCAQMGAGFVLGVLSGGIMPLLSDLFTRL